MPSKQTISSSQGGNIKGRLGTERVVAGEKGGLWNGVVLGTWLCIGIPSHEKIVGKYGWLEAESQFLPGC